MRQLTEYESHRVLELDEYLNECDHDVTIADTWAFNAGYKSAFDYQQRKLDAYAAYVAGKITQKELEEVING